MQRLFATTVVTGTLASVTSSLALAALAGVEGRTPFQPLNATSHWRHGPAAADVTRLDLPHTGVGYATHLAATLFWAALYAGWTRSRPPAAGPLLRDAALVSVLAAIVDYTVTPKRFTPGWEFVLSKRSMAGGYAAMALGLAAGARLVRR